MTLDNLTQIAAEAIERYRDNKTIMDFLTGEARAKVASEIREHEGGGTTALAVSLLEIRHKNIAKRVDRYVDAGLIGCYMASLEIK